MSDAPEVIVAGVDWETIAGIRMKMGCVTVGTTAYRETRRRDLPLPPLCCRQGSPETADPPATDLRPRCPCQRRS